MSKSTDQDTAARTGRVGVYDTSDSGRAPEAPSERTAVYDRPASADRSRISTTTIAIIVAIVVAILLLIWAL